MSPRLSNYLSPIIYPLYPTRVGTLHMVLSLRYLVAQRCSPDFVGDVTIDIGAYSSGAKLHSESHTVCVDKGRATPSQIPISYATENQEGYLEIVVTAEEPIFNRLVVDIGYAVLDRPGMGTLSVIGAEKFADIRIIDQIKMTGKFCIVHSAAWVSAAGRQGNHFLVINPYDKAAMVRLVSSTGKRMTQRLPAKSAKSISLSELVDDEKFATIMLTGNNRLICYDVRTIGDDGLNPNSIDHLDPFRGETTFVRVPAKRWFRTNARKMLRAIGRRRA